MNKKISDGSKAILQNILNVITECQHPSVEYISEGIVRENFTNYDLTTKEGRDKYLATCKSTIGFQTAFYSSLRHKKSGLPFSHKATVNIYKLDPWLSLYILTEDLDFQMETMDLCDGFDPEKE